MLSLIGALEFRERLGSSGEPVPTGDVPGKSVMLAVGTGAVPDKIEVTDDGRFERLLSLLNGGPVVEFPVGAKILEFAETSGTVIEGCSALDTCVTPVTRVELAPGGAYLSLEMIGKGGLGDGIEAAVVFSGADGVVPEPTGAVPELDLVLDPLIRFPSESV